MTTHPLLEFDIPASLTIERINSTVFQLPMLGALQWGAHSTLSAARHVLVEVLLNDGSSGVAEAPPRPTIYGETVHSITTVIEHELAPRLCQQPLPRAIARLHEIKNNQTAKGAIDMALHDALAQHRGISLREHLGATAERIRVSYILGIGERERIMAEAARVYAAGVRVLKVKVGRDWQADLALIDELRQHFGDELWLYADANECLTPATAPRVLDAMRERGVRYCEEPLPVELIQERAALRGQQRLPLIGDDSCFGPRDLQRELALDTFDILNIKTARTGYTDSHTMLQRAKAAGKGVMVGSQASTGLGTIRAALFAALPGIDHPSELSFFLKLKRDILSAPLELHAGYLHLADLDSISVDPARLHAAAVA